MKTHLKKLHMTRILIAKWFALLDPFCRDFSNGSGSRKRRQNDLAKITQTPTSFDMIEPLFHLYGLPFFGVIFYHLIYFNEDLLAHTCKTNIFIDI